VIFTSCGSPAYLEKSGMFGRRIYKVKESFHQTENIVKST
jgi:hypothetical protein